MGHEISQFDIPNRQLLATNAQPGVDMWTDIGEAKVSHSIFGKAKVRVIREQDKKRRTWLLTALASLVLAAVAWQAWIELQQMLSAAPPLPLSERIRVGAPVFQPEDITPHDAPSSGRSRSGSSLQNEINNLVSTRKSVPHQALGLKASEQMAAKPVAQPLTASKPQAASLAANKDQADMQQPSSLSVPIQPAVSADAVPPATQSAAKKPASVAPPTEMLNKENTSTQSSSGANQPSGSVNSQP